MQIGFWVLAVAVLFASVGLFVDALHDERHGLDIDPPSEVIQ